MSIELVSLHSRIWNLSGIEVCNKDPNDLSLENGSDPRLPSENLPPEASKDASLETIAAPISYPVNVDNDYYPTASEPQPTPQNAENCEGLDIEGDKGAGKQNVADENELRITNELSSYRDSGTPLLTDNGINEVHEMNVEIDTCHEQSKPAGDVEADVSKHEPLLDVSGLETSDKNDDASSASVVQMNPTTETYKEALAFVDVDASAGLPDQERDAPSVELHSTMMDAGDRQAIEVGDVNSGFETESLVRDDVLLEAAQENSNIELQLNSEQGKLDFDEHNEMHSAMLGEDIGYSSYAAQQDYSFMENGRSPEQAEAYYHHMMGVESSGFDMHDQEVSCLFVHLA